jgi:O-antigen/teichoic acid export membrane protein
LADQVLASATNFGLMLIVARSVPADQFGTFALVMATYTLVAYIGRGMSSDPLTTRFSSVPREEWANGVRGSTSAVLVFGLAAAGLVLLVSRLLPSPVGDAVAAFAVVIPGVLLQDHIRFALFALGRPARAFVNDAIWALAQIGGVVWILAVGSLSVAEVVLVWGGSGTAAALVGLLQLGERPRPSRTLWWLRGQRDLWGFYTIENALLQVTNILVLAVVGYVGGLAAAGSLRAATLVFGPLIVLSLGVLAVGVPELARLADRRPSDVRTAAIGIGAALALVGAAWGVLAHALPPSIGAFLLGGTWALAVPILLFVTVDVVASLFVLGPFMGLRALGSGRRSLNARVAFGVVRLVAASVGAMLGGALGAVIGFAIVAPVQMIVWSRQVSTAAAARAMAGTEAGTHGRV